MAYTVEIQGLSFVREESSGGVVRRPTIEFEDNALVIDGMRVSFEIIPQFLYELAHPDSRKWYRLERVGDKCVVHVKIDPQEPRIQ